MSVEKNKKLAIQKIKEYFPGINKEGINSIMANIQAETSFKNSNLIEGKFSWDTIREHGPKGIDDWKSINKKVDEWAKSNGYVDADGNVDEAKAKAAYKKLSKSEANSVKYYGNETDMAGGFGALQITAADSLPGRKDAILNIAENLGDGYTQEEFLSELENGNFELGLDLALSFYKNDKENPWTVEMLNESNPKSLRYTEGHGINPGEKFDEADHVQEAFSFFYGEDGETKELDESGTQWKRDLLKKVEERANSHFEMQLDGKTVSKEDLEIYYDYIDGLTYEEAVNEFGIEGEGDDFTIQTGSQDILDNINSYNLNVSTANAKGKLEKIINDENTSVSQKEKAKEQLRKLDQNLSNFEEAQRRKDDPAHKDRDPSTVSPTIDYTTGEEIDLNVITSDSVTSLVEEIEEDITSEHEDAYDTEQEKIDKEGKKEPEGFYRDGKFYEYAKVEAGAEDEITTSGLLDKGQGTELPSAISGMSFEEWQERFPDGTREDYNAIMNQADKNLQNAGEETYFDLRGKEGLGKESFLDKMGGLSSLIGLATGAIGLGQALKKVDIPKDPKLGPAFQQRLSESKRLAKQGLTPSELAKAHNDLDSSYATGIENIVRGSAGNRAQFMAGLGGLDVARQSALMDIAVADASMQRDNQQKYDSMMMVNEQYEAARQAKYQDAQYQQDSANKAAGAALAGSAFSMVNDAISSRHINRYNKMKTEKLLMDMGYKGTKDGKSGQDQVGAGTQTSFSVFDTDNNDPDFNLLNADDQAVNTNISNQPANQNQGNNLINTSPLNNTSSGLINNPDNQVNLGNQMYDIFNTGY